MPSSGERIVRPIASQRRTGPNPERLILNLERIVQIVEVNIQLLRLTVDVEWDKRGSASAGPPYCGRFANTLPIAQIVRESAGGA